MDNLRDFLSSRCKPNYRVSGDQAWEQLTRKLDDLKERDQNEVSFGGPHNLGLNIDSVINRCINTLHNASHHSKSPFAIVPKDTIGACEAAIKDLEFLASEVHFIRKNEFVNRFINTEVTIPLLLIWKLHKVGILQISTYVFRKLVQGSENLLSGAVVWLLSNSKESKEYVEVAKDTFASLLIASQSRSLNLQLATICASTLKKCADDSVSSVMNQFLLEKSAPLDSSIDFVYLTSTELWSCGADGMEQFVQAHLMHLLECCTVNSDKSLVDAVSIQEKCALNNITPLFKNFVLSIVKGLGAEKVVNQLGVAVIRPSINWKIIFMLIAVLLSENPECSDDIKKLTDELIQVGLEGGRKVELSAGLLIARQCCSCDSKNFGSYSLWFSSHFGLHSTTARNSVQYQALLHVLTEFVPVESAENLRVHINKVPQAPPSCHSLLHDYTVLARTRLADLNESSELTGLFSDSSRDAVPGLDSKQADIVRVLQHFKNTKEILKPVLEASVLRRQYYRNVFLVELLGLPGSADKSFKPEDFDLTNDTRHEFILALKTIGKIPDKVFQTYLEKESLKEKLINNTESKETVKLKKDEVSQPAKKKKGLDLKSRGPAH